MKKMISLLTVLCFLFISCSNFIDSIENPSTHDDSITYITFTDQENMASRLVLPISGYDKQKISSIELKGYLQNSTTELYELQFTRNYTSLNQLISDSIPGQGGNWKFYLTAVQSNLPLLYATVYREIVSGQKNSVYFQLKPYNDNNFVYNAYVPTSMKVKLLSAMVFDGKEFTQTTTGISEELISSGKFNGYTKYSFENL